MTILHISDFHYKANKKFDQNLAIDKLLESLKLRNAKIDYVFFTGDLVNSGTNYDHFLAAHDLLFGSLIKKAGVKAENIFICAGNHDIDWGECSEAVITFFDKKIDSNDTLNDYFIKPTNKDLKNSFFPLANYRKYFKEKFSVPTDMVQSLYSIHKRDFQGAKVGIVTLNSPWLCSGFKDRKDERQLLIPSVIVKEVLNNIRDCQLKILLIHHPLYWLKEWNDLVIEDLIHSNFNLMFSGHVHKEKIETRFNANNGIFCNTAQAVLTFDEDGQIGYSLLDFDCDDCSSITIERSSYFKKENKLVELEPVKVTIPIGEAKNRQNKLRQKISSKFTFELQNANELMLNYDGDNGLNFIESFTAPVLSKNSDVDTLAKEKESVISFDKLLSVNENYLIFGRDKSGKTSVLKMIQLNLLKNYTKNGLAPFYVDYKELEHKDGDYNLQKAIEHYFQINNNDATELVNGENLVLLIDNLNSDYPIHKIIMDFLERHPNVKFVMSSDWLTTKIYIAGLDGLQHTKLFFRDLSRTEIRMYAEKQSHLKSTDKEQVLEKITHLCKQLQLPINYWTVSLIILIYKKSNDDYHKNLFGILDLCVDEFLNKRKLSVSKGSLQFEQYKQICSKIAKYLLIEHKDNVYTADYDEIIAFIASLISGNTRIVGNPRDILDFLLETAILRKKGNRYTFRLNGIFEYFLAYHLKENEQFKEEILNDDSIFLSFKNELEIYSGLVRDDEPFLIKLYGKTIGRFDPIINKYKAFGTLDNTLTTKFGEARDFADTIKKIKVDQALTHKDQDDARDELDPLKSDSDVHLKEVYDMNEANYEMLERYISITARVFRNSDGISDFKLIERIFDYLLEAYCYLGFYLIDTFEEYAKAENLKHSEAGLTGKVIGEELLQMVARFVPVLSQTSFYNGIGQPNIKNIISKKIAKLKIDSKENQYKLFILYFMLMDIDSSEARTLIPEVFETITLSALKVSTLFKLSYYLAFTATNNKEREAFLKNQVQTAQIRLNNKQDANDLQKGLANTSQSNLVKKQKRK